MSYGLRNTIILLIVLTTFIAGGWSYIYFYQQPEIDRLEGKVQKVRQELNNKQQIANQYPVLKNRFDKATKFFKNHPKALYASSNEDNVFDFLNTISRGSAFTDFSFSFKDSTTNKQYGIMTMEVTGQAYYRNFNNFIRQIELNKPLNKISQLSISPINQLESYGRISFKMTLESFYDRVKLLGKPNLTISNNLLGSVFNPFYPLIRSVAPNEKDLVNIEKSTLMAIGNNEVFVIDQNGVMQKINQGEDVYLGKLKAVNVDKGTATFQLNKGGIIENIILQVNNEEDDENKSSN